MSDQRFQLFWEKYPRKLGRKTAEQKFKAAMKRVDYATLMAGLEGYIGDDNAHGNGAYYKHPSTWLNQDGWADYPPGGKKDLFSDTGKQGNVEEFRRRLYAAKMRDYIPARVEPSQESKDRVAEMLRKLRRGEL